MSNNSLRDLTEDRYRNNAEAIKKRLQKIILKDHEYPEHMEKLGKRLRGKVSEKTKKLFLYVFSGGTKQNVNSN